MQPEPATDYPLAQTPAARMLAAGLQRASEERGLSLRTVGKLLNYRQAVVLSHMAMGRVPIPIDRAEDLAGVLGLDKKAFLAAVVEQRHPKVDWSLLSGVGAKQSGDAGALAQDLEAIVGRPIAQLTREHRKVMREVVADPHPERRWLTIHEVPAIETLRKHRRNLREGGLDQADRLALEQALKRS